MSSKTILFADDSATMRTIMEKTFAAEPFDVLAVPSGEAAIAKVRELRPAVVIADIGMAGLSGYDVCKAIRGDNAVAYTPVILMGGVSSPYDDARGQEVGATDFVKKPFDTTQLIEKVTELSSLTLDGPAEEIVEEIEVDEEMADEEPAPVPLAMARPQMSAPAQRPVVAPQMSPQPVPRQVMAQPAMPQVASQPAMAASPAKGGTREFGRMDLGAMPFRPAQPQPLPQPQSLPQGLGQPPVQAYRPEPRPKPIDLDEPEIQAPAATFKVNTLAELAQMGEHGSRLEPTPRRDAVDLPPSSDAEMELDHGHGEVEEYDEEVPDTDEAFGAPEPPRPEDQTVVKKIPTKPRAEEAAAEVAASVKGLTPEQTLAIREVATEVIERVVWEIVPELAEAIIREELKRLLEE